MSKTLSCKGDLKNGVFRNAWLLAQISHLSIADKFLFTTSQPSLIDHESQLTANSALSSDLPIYLSKWINYINWKLGEMSSEGEPLNLIYCHLHSLKFEPVSSWLHRKLRKRSLSRSIYQQSSSSAAEHGPRKTSLVCVLENIWGLVKTVMATPRAISTTITNIC